MRVCNSFEQEVDVLGLIMAPFRAIWNVVKSIFSFLFSTELPRNQDSRWHVQREVRHEDPGSRGGWVSSQSHVSPHQQQVRNEAPVVRSGWVSSQSHVLPHQQPVRHEAPVVQSGWISSSQSHVSPHQQPVHHEDPVVQSGWVSSSQSHVVPQAQPVLHEDSGWVKSRSGNRSSEFSSFGGERIPVGGPRFSSDRNSSWV